MRTFPSENRRVQSRGRSLPVGKGDELQEQSAMHRRKADTFLSRKRSRAHAMAICERVCRACLWIQGVSGFRLEDGGLFLRITVTWTDYANLPPNLLGLTLTGKFSISADSGAS